MQSRRPMTESQNEDCQHAIPASLWEGDFGVLARRLGLSPDDPENRIPDRALIEQLYRDGQEALARRVTAVNEQVAERTGGKKLAPYALISDSVWNGPEGDVLLALGFSPYDDWNIALLPTDYATARLLDLPIHPRREVDGFVELARSILGREIAGLRDAHSRAARDHDFAAYRAHRERVCERVRELAARIHDEMHALTKRHLKAQSA